MESIGTPWRWAGLFAFKIPALIAPGVVALLIAASVIASPLRPHRVPEAP